MEKKIIENHQINIEERMRVREGHVLKEQKVKILLKANVLMVIRSKMSNLLKPLKLLEISVVLKVHIIYFVRFLVRNRD